MKPGYKTTEFWIVLVVNLIAGLQASGLVADGSIWAKGIAFATMALATAGYTYGRAYVKSAEQQPKLGNPDVKL